MKNREKSNASPNRNRPINRRNASAVASASIIEQRYAEAEAFRELCAKAHALQTQTCQCKACKAIRRAQRRAAGERQRRG